MAKSLVLGNGNLLLCFDASGRLKDLYYPYVGLENHVGRGLSHRVGVFADGRMVWLSDPGWDLVIDYRKETMVGSILATHAEMEVALKFTDVVHNEDNIYLRTVDVKNTSNRDREIKIYFNQQFQISEYAQGDTGYYAPENNAIIHYKGKRLFLISGKVGRYFFDDYSIGLFGIEGKEGAWRDAEDGALTKNAIEHGSVDSVIGFTLQIAAGKEQSVNYWIVFAEQFQDALKLHQMVQKRGVPHFIETTEAYWRAWVNKRTFLFHGLTPEVVDLFKKSLLIMRTHADNRGGIIASGDSDILQGGRDTYAYVWPRDGAYIALALDKAGYFDISKRFYSFCADALTDEGYLLHKYRPDGSLGSSWHPWIEEGKSAPPIQEDETALPVLALWEHYQATKDLEFVESLYDDFIKNAADFFVRYRDPKTGLPYGSFDLWEESRGTSCYTASAVSEALVAAAKFSRLLGKEIIAQRYERVAEVMRRAIIEHFVDADSGVPIKMLHHGEKSKAPNRTMDAASAYGLFRFKVLAPDDKRLIQIFEALESRLHVQTKVGGIARYEGDKFHQVDPSVPGNPWFIPTFWQLEYYIARAKSEADLGKVRHDLAWATHHLKNAGILSEQMNPLDGKQLGAAPLAWSHGAFVITVVAYLEKLEQLGVCKTCYPIGHDHLL